MRSQIDPVGGERKRKTTHEGTVVRLPLYCPLLSLYCRSEALPAGPASSNLIPP